MGADIEVFRAAVGTSPATGGDPSADLVVLLGGQFEATPTDRYDGTDSAYWCFHEAGTELLWIDTVLSSAEIFVQGDAENGYAPYPRQLFAELLNTATRTEVEATLSVPDRSGQWQGAQVDPLRPGRRQPAPLPVRRLRPDPVRGRERAGVTPSLP